MFGIVSQPSGGFDPRAGTRTVISPRHPLVAALRAVVMAGTLGLGMAVMAASPAYAATQLTVTKSIAAPLGARYAWACARGGEGRIVGSENLLRAATIVNRKVNRSVREVSDSRQYRIREHWALPTRQGGDCEDFALLKKRELLRAGVPPDRLMIATVLDRKRRAHAVLVLRTDDGDYVLDNLTNRIKTWDRTGYSFLRMQDPRTKSGWKLVLRGGIFS